MEAVWNAAIARVAEEVADMQAVADEEGAGITIEPWDYRHYAEKVRKAKYDLDSDEVKQYLQLDKLREAMFFVAGELFNFAVHAGRGRLGSGLPRGRQGLGGHRQDDRRPHRPVVPRSVRPSGQALRRLGDRPIAATRRSTARRLVLGSNNSNFIKGAPGEPVLVSWDDASTFFHEFGHALHYFSSNVEYPTLNGGVRDYTEFQSQLLERWLLTDEVINLPRAPRDR